MLFLPSCLLRLIEPTSCPDCICELEPLLGPLLLGPQPSGSALTFWSNYITYWICYTGNLYCHFISWVFLEWHYCLCPKFIYHVFCHQKMWWKSVMMDHRIGAPKTLREESWTEQQLGTSNTLPINSTISNWFLFQLRDSQCPHHSQWLRLTSSTVSFPFTYTMKF